ncbi:MAG: dihydropteroate synthase [Acidobacteriota bacterium]|nr:dihydropteroate synthase [Acidobacteriota bacterium]
MNIRFREHTFAPTAERPLVMGIVNLGRDSVADALRLDGPAEQYARALELIAAGADIIDVGVQSGRTDTAAVSESEELALLAPLVSRLADEGVCVSVDAWRPAVVQGAIDAGAALVNDVSGLADVRVADIAAQSGAGLVVMHTRARPKERRFPTYQDPLADVAGFLAERCETARKSGVDAERIVIDPGLDFAKAPSDSIEILRRLPELHALGYPLLLAVSRKYFVGMLTGRRPLDRLAGTLAAVAHGVGCGAQIVRVHDVAAVADFLTVREVLLAEGIPQLQGDPDDEALKWIAPKRGA